MNKQVLKLSVIAGVIIFSILSFAIKFWADGELYQIEGPSFFRVTPNNELAVLQQHQLVFTNSYGETSRHIDLDAEDINNQGDYDFFSNGDLLVYHRDHSKSFIENIARFLRLKEFRENKPKGKDGLYRCDSYGRLCQLFSEELPAFDSAFRLVIDRETDTVYIADTPRFKIYKLNSEGKLLAKKEKGFKFPNQLFLQGASLYVANTNLHEVAQLDTSDENFGKKNNTYSTTINHIHKWPSQLAFTGSNWWLVIMDNGMKDGLLRVYDTNWNEIIQPELPANADPVGIIYFNEKIYVSDWSNFAIYRYNYDGKQLGTFINPELDKLFKQARDLQDYYSQLSLLSMVVFATVLIAGFFAAWKLEKKETLDVLTGKNQLPTFEKSLAELEPTPGTEIYWLESKHKKRNRFLEFLIFVVLLMLSVSYVMLLIEEGSKPWQFHVILLGMMALTPYVFIQWRKILNVKIGAQGNKLFIDNGYGVILSGEGSQIKYNQGAFSIDGHVAMIGAPQQRLFDKEELNKWIIPRLQQGEVMGQLEVLKMLWREKHPVLNMLLMTIVALTAMYLATLC